MNYINNFKTQNNNIIDIKRIYINLFYKKSDNEIEMCTFGRAKK